MEKPSESKSKAPVKIGIVIGAGTGRRLAVIFRKFLEKLAEKHSIEVEFLEDPDEKSGLPPYHSYKSLEDTIKEEKQGTQRFREISLIEADRLVNTMEKWHAAGVRTVFRTSINAETLYLFRQCVRAVKEFGLTSPLGKKVLFIRDQAEGFYANTYHSINEQKGEINFSGKFTKEHQQAVVDYALSRAKSVFGDEPFQTWAIYKHHLFGNLLKEWAREVDKEITVYQPDTGISNLNRFYESNSKKREKKSNLLVICANEIGDIIYEALSKTVDPDAKLMLYAKNAFLSNPFLGKFGEYQTVHGSADDKQDSDDLLPYATFLIAAEIATKDFGAEDIEKKMDNAIVFCRRKGLDKTLDIVKEISSHFQIEMK